MQRCLQNEEQVKPIYFICVCIKAIQVIKREFQYFIFIKIRVSEVNFNLHGIFPRKFRLSNSSYHTLELSATEAAFSAPFRSIFHIKTQITRRERQRLLFPTGFFIRFL